MGQLSRPEKNKLFPEYGINFRYIGEVKNGLDRVSVVTSIPIPRFKDLRINPIQFHNCSADLDLKNDNHRQLHIAISEWCTRATPYLQHIKRKEKYFARDFMVSWKMTYMPCSLNYEKVPHLLGTDVAWEDSVLSSGGLDHPGSGEHRFLLAEETGAMDTEHCDCYARRH